MILSILAAAAIYAGVAGDPRQDYSACLKDAVVNAKITNVPADGFRAFAHQHCAAAEDSFKKKLAAFNIKNGMGRKSATDDAQVQIEDYVYSAEDRYSASLAPASNRQAAASSPSK